MQEKTKKMKFERKNFYGFDLQKTLTKRELEVLEHIIKGENNSKIADSLGISKNTVKKYILKINEKLGVKNKLQAAVQAIMTGLIK